MKLIKIKNFLKRFETVRILLGLRNTKKIFDLVNKSDFDYYDKDKNKMKNILSELEKKIFYLLRYHPKLRNMVDLNMNTHL